MTIRASKLWLGYGVAMAWFYLLLWPLLGIKPEGLQFAGSFAVWLKVAVAAAILVALYQLKQGGLFRFLEAPSRAVGEAVSAAAGRVPRWLSLSLLLACAIAFPFFTERYAHDVAISVLVYIMLGLGLNIVVGLAGLLDLGYIAFFGVGAYTYALLSVHFELSFWLCLPISACFSAIAGCIIGYPTLRMRGDYLAIVTLGFGEIVRIVINNWMSLTNGPNGVLGIKSPGAYWFKDGSFEHIWLNHLEQLYFVILALAVFTILAVYRINYSRIGRAFEAVREDQTAAELMGVNTFRLKLLAYALGAVFGGLAGSFFAARMKFVSPESFTFIESAMVLAMVVLGGMGSIPGVILGSLALIALPEVFRGFEMYRMFVFGGVMAVMMIFRPRGLWPAKRMGARSEEKD
ncbi:branched-chain amino acid transport system permease protein [Humidesulfovibrio mexicanus]|uniref:Branched-chain amino acid transport system permease protein n=2 Tax=Humidesulfovibrio mexicanus TaxID=147047 RepID=A0A238YAW2_9BACT|nr:branched-chain amino acid transport system permease protein [Humidesulfovibrio mexicanus]